MQLKEFLQNLNWIFNELDLIFYYNSKTYRTTPKLSIISKWDIIILDHVRISSENGHWPLYYCINQWTLARARTNKYTIHCKNILWQVSSVLKGAVLGNWQILLKSLLLKLEM